MDANKKSVSKWSFRCRLTEAQMLVEFEARGYKDRNAREHRRNYLKLFSIILHSQGFTQTVLRFLFGLVLFLFEDIEMAIAAAASSLLVILLLEIEIKEFK